MRFQSFRIKLILISLSGLLAQPFFADHSSAQAGFTLPKSGYEFPLQRSDKTKPGKGSDVWRDPVIAPPPKPRPRRGRRPPPPPPMAPRLTIEWRILQCGPDGTDLEVSPEKIFHTNDHWRLGIKTNQNGYLYVITQTEGPEGSVTHGPKQIFPDSEIINSQDYVIKEKEQLLPPRCSPERERRCGCRWYFGEASGSERIIIIFSRELLTDLSYNRIGGNLIKPSYVSQLINRWDKLKTEKKIKQTSDPNRVPKAGGAMPYAIWVTNDDLKNNRELVWVISLANAGKRAGQ
jgi:Domain of unknown function (DUF4384)